MNGTELAENNTLYSCFLTVNCNIYYTLHFFPTQKNKHLQTPRINLACSMIYSYILEFKAVIDQAHFEHLLTPLFTGANLPNRANCAGAFIPGHVPRPRQGAHCLRDRCKNSPAGTVAHWWNMERKNELRPPWLKDIESTCWQITWQEHGSGEPGPESTLTSVKLCKSQAVAASCFRGTP